MNKIPNEVDITITAHDLTGPGFASALANMERLRARAESLRKEVGNIGSPEIDANRLTSSLLLLKQKMQSLGIADIADINVNPGALMVQLQLLKRLIQQAGISDMLDINVNPASLQTAMSRIADASKTIAVPIRFDIAPFPQLPIPAPIIAPVVPTEAAPVPGYGTSESVGAPISQSTLAAMTAALDDTYKLNAGLGNLNTLLVASGIYWDRLRAGISNVKDAISGGLSPYLLGLRMSFNSVGSAVSALVGAGGAGGAGLVGLAAGLGGAGGAAGRMTRALGGTFAGIALWHIALDGIIEALIAVGLAVAAALPALSIFVNVGQDIVTNLQSQRVIFESLHQTIGPLTGQFDALAQKMAPQVIEAYGGALNLITGRQGLFGDAVVRVTHIFDDWIAKIDIFASGTGLQKFLSSGVGYLTQFGQIVGNVGQALGNLLTKDPGVAHYLLDIFNAMALLLKAFTSLPGPIVEFVLVAHGIYLWGSVMIGLFGPLIGGFVRMGITIAGIVGPMLGLSTASGTMAKSFLGISAVSWAWVGVVAAGIGILAYEMTQADSSTKKFISDINQGLQGLSASQAIGQISLDIGQVQAQLSLVPAKIGAIVTNLTDAAGTSVSFFARASHDALGTNQQFTDLAKGVFNAAKAFFGFQSAGAQIMQVKNSASALTGEIVHLTGAQNNLFAEIGALIGRGNTYSESLAIMDLAGVQAGDSLALMNAKVNNLIKGYQNIVGDAGALNNSLQAVNFAALQQQSQVSQLNGGWDAFIKTITGGEDSLLTFGSDLNTMATNAAAAKSSFTGFNASSITLTQSFQTALKDANTYADNLTLLASASGGGATATGLLNKGIVDMVSLLLPAAKNSSTLTTELYALAQRGGYTGADSFKALSTWIGNTKNPMDQLNSITQTLTTSAGNLTTDVKNLSIALGTTLNNAMATAIFQARGGQAVFNDFANSIVQTGVGSVRTQQAAQNLAIALYYQLGRNTNLARQEFESFAISGLGLTKRQADILWQSTLPALQRSINNLHGTTLTINAIASGQGGVSVTASGIAAKEIALSRLAGGGMVTGGIPGKDSVIAALTPGEVVVPVSMVQGGAVDHLRGQLQGFAAGGFVTLERRAGAYPGVVSRDVALDAQDLIAADLQTEINRDLAALRKAAQQAAKNAAFPATGLPLGSGPLSSSAAVAQAFAKSILWAYGWNMGQWPYEVALWNQESGWNAYAVNPASGAYGIPQALPGVWDHPYALGDYQAQVRWGDAYISGRYGNPQNAWAHEVANNWYDNGGWLKPGWNPPMYNGTGKPEFLVPRPSGPTRAQNVLVQLEVSAGGGSVFEQFMLTMIRNFVRLHGGGDAQKAFGLPNTHFHGNASH